MNPIVMLKDLEVTERVLPLGLMPDCSPLPGMFFPQGLVNPLTSFTFLFRFNALRSTLTIPALCPPAPHTPSLLYPALQSPFSITLRSFQHTL